MEKFLIIYNKMHFPMELMLWWELQVESLILSTNGSLRLGEVQYLVLDEADQMLAVGFEEDVEVILEKLPTKRQSMLFSLRLVG